MRLRALAPAVGLIALVSGTVHNQGSLVPRTPVAPVTTSLQNYGRTNQQHPDNSTAKLEGEQEIKYKRMDYPPTSAFFQQAIWKRHGTNWGEYHRYGDNNLEAWGVMDGEAFEYRKSETSMSLQITMDGRSINIGYKPINGLEGTAYVADNNDIRILGTRKFFGPEPPSDPKLREWHNFYWKHYKKLRLGEVDKPGNSLEEKVRG